MLLRSSRYDGLLAAKKAQSLRESLWEALLSDLVDQQSQAERAGRNATPKQPENWRCRIIQFQVWHQRWKIQFWKDIDTGLWSREWTWRQLALCFWTRRTIHYRGLNQSLPSPEQTEKMDVGCWAWDKRLRLLIGKLTMMFSGSPTSIEYSVLNLAHCSPWLVSLYPLVDFWQAWPPPEQRNHL